MKQAFMLAQIQREPSGARPGFRRSAYDITQSADLTRAAFAWSLIG
jgi:hypothetical protein